MILQDEELIHDYVTECREHLADIETQLLAVESAGANIDDNLVNKIFRAAHSIKGGAGLLDLAKIKDLSHKTENVLGLIRSRSLVPTPEIINILLLSFDRLRDLVNNIKTSNDIDTSDISVALTGLTSTSLPMERKPSLAMQIEVPIPGSVRGKSIRASAFDFDQAEQSHQTVYLLEYDLASAGHAEGRMPLEVIGKLSKHGTILDCNVDQGATSPFLCVLFATNLSVEQVTSLSAVAPKAIRRVDSRVLSKQEPVAPPLVSLPRLGNLPQIVPQVEVPACRASESSSNPFVSTLPQTERGESLQVSQARPEFQEEARSGLLQPVASGKDAPSTDTTLRVNVALLEFLMNLAGELVLSRNQLNEAIAHEDLEAIRSGSHRINAVTSELQQTIVQTRLQPIGNILSKFPRMVRNLSRELGKEIQLEIVGRDVEMDKTIIEGLSDPLTHMVRNAVDHGIESPEKRRLAGKNPIGTIEIRASHEAGQVIVEVRDDGGGLDPRVIADAAIARRVVTAEQVRQMSVKEILALILIPGVSTARQVTDVSGRGVGMDVVKSNLDGLAGKVEIESELGKGALFRIKLPLTLAIIPSLLISAAGQRFAIPQVNVNELLRIPAAQIKSRFELVGDAEVLLQRGELIPVVHLGDVLGIERFFIDPEDGVKKLERRAKLADRRSARYTKEGHPFSRPDADPESDARREGADRRFRAVSDVNIAIVSASSFRYGLVVDELHDTLEIVVKPLGRHLKRLREYAGATILGDGTVALILDASGLAAKARLNSLGNTLRARELAQETKRIRLEEPLSLLLFRNGPDEQCAVPLAQVTRVELVGSTKIENIVGKRTVRYRGASLPLVVIGDTASIGTIADDSDQVVIVFEINGREIGLLGAGPVDAIDVDVQVDRSIHKQKGIIGSAIVRDKTTLIVDLRDLVEISYPEWVVDRGRTEQTEVSNGTVLLAEDSDFFRGQIRKHIESIGCRVLCAEDGQVAWQVLIDNAGKVDMLVTDVEMPRLNGLELARRVRAEGRFGDLPIVALSSLAGEDDIARGLAAGVTEYLVKLDGEKLIETIRRLLKDRAPTQV